MELTAEQLKELLAEMMARFDHPLQHMQPIEFQLRDPVPSETRPKRIGIITKAKFDILKDFYDWLIVAPEACTIRCIGWIEEEGEPVEAPAKKKTKAQLKKESDGPHGAFWQDMFLEQIIGRSDFQQWTGIMPGLDGWKEKLHAIFSVDSLTHISPEMLTDWLANAAGPDRLKDLIAKIKSIAGMQAPSFPAGQYFSPFDLGASVKSQSDDEQFAKENLLP